MTLNLNHKEAEKNARAIMEDTGKGDEISTFYKKNAEMYEKAVEEEEKCLEACKSKVIKLWRLNDKCFMDRENNCEWQFYKSDDYETGRYCKKCGKIKKDERRYRYGGKRRRKTRKRKSRRKRRRKRRRKSRRKRRKR